MKKKQNWLWQKINKMKIWFFQKVNKRQSISQSDQGKKKKVGVEKNQNNKVRNKNGEITTDNTEIHT